MTHHVVNDAVSINESTVNGLIAHIRKRGPAAHVGFGQPEMVGSESAGWNGVAKEHGTFANSRIIIKHSGEPRGRSRGVNGIDVKRHDHVCRSSCDRAVKKSVTRHAGAVEA